jgi:hypothetical protein
MAFGAVVFFWPFIESFLRRKLGMPEALSVFLGVVAFLGFLGLTVWEAFAV